MVKGHAYIDYRVEFKLAPPQGLHLPLFYGHKQPGFKVK